MQDGKTFKAQAAKHGKFGDPNKTLRANVLCNFKHGKFGDPNKTLRANLLCNFSGMLRPRDPRKGRTLRGIARENVVSQK